MNILYVLAILAFFIIFTFLTNSFLCFTLALIFEKYTLGDKDYFMLWLCVPFYFLIFLIEDEIEKHKKVYHPFWSDEEDWEIVEVFYDGLKHIKNNYENREYLVENKKIICSGEYIIKESISTDVVLINHCYLINKKLKQYKKTEGTCYEASSYNYLNIGFTGSYININTLKIYNDVGNLYPFFNSPYLEPLYYTLKNRKIYYLDKDKLYLIYSNKNIKDFTNLKNDFMKLFYENIEWFKDENKLNDFRKKQDLKAKLKGEI